MSVHNFSKEALIGSATLGVIFIAGYYVGKRKSKQFRMSSGKSHVGRKDDPVMQYLLSHSLREHPALTRLRQVRTSLNMIMVACEQSQLMANLARLIKVKKAIEIGVYTGYNALSIALTLPEDGKLIACDVSEEYIDIGRPFWRLVRCEPTLFTSLFTLISALTVQDALLLQSNVYTEGILGIQKIVLWSGRVVNPEEGDIDSISIDKLNKKLHRDVRIQLSMLTVGDGLTLAFKI
uniref:Catechol-O-methyltransferase domain containing 1 n=1 Tax=Cyprinus carpio TaxID=7962 RepID=A0A8C1LA93_CYPCA